MQYWEEDSVMRVWIDNASFDFKVQNTEKAMIIIKKIYDAADSSLIELEKD